VIRDETRIDLLGNQLVLIAPNDSKLDNVIIGPDFNLARLVGDGRIATADVRAQCRSGNMRWQHWKSLGVERCRIEICND